MQLISIGLLFAFFAGVSILLAMLASAPTWTTLLAFVLGIVTSIGIAVIAGDTDKPEVTSERKPTKAKAELVIETQREYKELEPGQSKSLTIVRY